MYDVLFGCYKMVVFPLFEPMASKVRISRGHEQTPADTVLAGPIVTHDIRHQIEQVQIKSLLCFRRRHHRSILLCVAPPLVRNR